MRAMSFIVYVDDFNSYVVNEIAANPIRSMSTGIRLAIHGRGTKPDFSTGVSAGPGTDTSITVTPVSRQRLDVPYNGCSNSWEFQSEEDTAYSASYCTEQCLQNMIIEKCGCLSSDLSFTTEQFHRVNSTMCYNQSWLENNGANPNITIANEIKAFYRIKCLYDTILPIDYCIDDCLPRCSELKYFTTSSHSSPWPHISRHLPFYKKYINGTDHADKFKDYARIERNLNVFKNISVVEALAQLRQLGLIERNFLQVNVLLEDYVYTTLTEVPTMPNEVLLSNIGGVLSLWLGVTVMTFVEITEAIYFVVAIFYDKVRKKIEPFGHNVVMVGEKSIKN